MSVVTRSPSDWRRARTTIGLTRTELAERAGCSPRTLEALEAGNRHASAELARRIDHELIGAATKRREEIAVAVEAIALTWC